jgi:hypothetical protein
MMGAEAYIRAVGAGAGTVEAAAWPSDEGVVWRSS